MLILEATKCMDTTLNGRERKHPYQAGDNYYEHRDWPVCTQSSRKKIIQQDLKQTKPNRRELPVMDALSGSVGRTDKLKKTFYIISSQMIIIIIIIIKQIRNYTVRLVFQD